MDVMLTAFDECLAEHKHDRSTALEMQEKQAQLVEMEIITV